MAGDLPVDLSGAVLGAFTRFDDFFATDDPFQRSRSLILSDVAA